jgi:hypothetical protein
VNRTSHHWNLGTAGSSGTLTEVRWGEKRASQFVRIIEDNYERRMRQAHGQSRQRLTVTNANQSITAALNGMGLCSDEGLKVVIDRS